MKDTKTIKIHSDLHYQIKLHCAEKGIDIQSFVTKILSKSIAPLAPKPLKIKK